MTLIIATVTMVLFLLLSINLDPWWAFPMLYASVAVHEIEHLLAARIVGTEAGSVVVGGLMILRSGDRWVTRFEWRRILSGGLAKSLARKRRFPFRDDMRGWWPADL